MSKAKPGNILLLPGETGWEVWSLEKEGSRLAQSGYQSALEVTQIPAGQGFVMAFPVRELTSLCLWGPSDQELARELVELQIEKRGLRQAPERGQLYDFTTLSNPPQGGEVLYAIDVLAPPEEGKLPRQAPTSFTVSARCFPLQASALTLWQEFGRWVLAVTNQQGELMHYQSLTAKDLGPEMGSECRLLTAHLRLQNLLPSNPSTLVVWTDQPSLQPAGLEAFGRSLAINPLLEEKPIPQHPRLPSALLPADTRAVRLAQDRRKKRVLATVLASLLCLAAAGYGLYRLWDLNDQTQQAEAAAEDLRNSNRALLDHVQKWEELGPLVDSKNDPLELLKNCIKEIPNANLRLKRVELTHQFAADDQRIVLSVNLQGEADKLEYVNTYDSRLKSSAELSHLSWENPAASQTKNGWGFVYRAEPK